LKQINRTTLTRHVINFYRLFVFNEHVVPKFKKIFLFRGRFIARHR